MEASWKTHLESEFEQLYFQKLRTFVHDAYTQSVVYPSPKNLFRAFDLCPFDQTKVVILGQDPYHGPGQANGLCFAVAEDAPLPPSLKNIFKEIEKEYGASMQNKTGDLSRWAAQGVLLLNATLTVQARSPGSHQHKGWEEFTDAAIQALSKEREGLVFMLWGNYAKNKGAHIDRKKHRVLEAAHPSPFSAHSGFFGCNHFKLANDYLVAHGKKPIEWL
jgi:uracil-DNA glycosylase